jgi:glycosyltransferase involved in cell wall biosynthesis
VPRRILLLITDLEIGGTPTVVREIATRLRHPPEVEVEVACLKAWGPVADQLRDAGIRVTAFGMRRPWQLGGAVSELSRIVRDRSIDTVFSFLLHANFVAARASRRLPGVRFFQSIQTIQQRPKWHWWLQWRIHHAAERIVCPSSAVARVARERCGVPDGKIFVIPNGIDPDAFPRVDVFVRPGVVRVGFLGRFDPVKQLDHFVASVQFVSSEVQRVEGHIFGSGPDDPTVYIDRYNARDRVFVRGPVSRPQDALREMDVLFSTSLEEGFGLVVLEAMASGVPVVARAGGGVTDFVKDRVNGLLIVPDMFDYRFLSLRLNMLIDDLELRRTVIEGGLHTAREYSWDSVMQQYRQLLDLNQS